jgi:hypothetical protein
MDSQQTRISDAELALQEYRSLRETIQTRGSLRVTLAAATVFVWAALSLWCWTSAAGFLVGLVPLVALWAGFEVVLSLHTGVERIGRYVQRMFESGAPMPPAWEHVAVAMGPHWLSPKGLDPLFTNVFLVAAFLNFIQAGAGSDSMQLTLASVLHLVMILRILLARRFASIQRKADIVALESVISSNALVSRIQQRQ